MSAQILTVDLGNSRCKLALWDAEAAGQPRLVRAADWPSDPQRAAASLAAIEAWLRAGPAPRAASLAAVGRHELERELRERLVGLVTEGQVATPDPGLELDVREAHTVGLDRLFAARGAAERVGESALVLDAGTALTVDALELVRAGGGATRRVFRGGAIAPGPELLAEALARRAARLVAVRPRPGVRALGRRTPEAIEAGVVLGFRGAARELVRGVGEESGLAQAPLVLTGGARGFLLEPPLFDGRRLVVVEDLVHLGLLAALLERG